MLEYYYSDQIYLLSTATLLLAVIIALYCSNVLKDKNQSIQDEGNEQGKYNAQDVSDDSATFDNADLDGGMLAKLKAARLKTFEAQLTNDQLEEERRVEREQLAAIFELLKKQESELNVKEIDEGELKAQMSLYR